MTTAPGRHRAPETEDDTAMTAPGRHPRRNTIIAVGIIVLGVLALGVMIYWQEHRYDEYGRDLGCAFSRVNGVGSEDCDD